MLRPQPLSIFLVLLMSMPLWAQGDDDPMIKEFEKFVKSKGSQSQLKNDPAYQESLRRRGEQQRLVEEAIKEQDAALAGTRDDIEKILTLYASRATTRGEAIDHYLYGRILGHTGDLDGAYQEFMSALSLDRYFPWAWDGLGVYHSNKGNWAAAIEKFKRVLQLWPGHVKATFGLAQCYFRINRYSEGVVRLQEILARPEIRDQPEVQRQTRLLIAEALRNEKKFDEAIRILTEVLQDYPKDTRVLAMRAWCSRRLDRFGDAARDYEAILVLQPETRRYYEQLADCCVSEGRNADAVKVLERLLEHAAADLTTDQLARYHEAIAALKRKPAREDPKKRQLTLDDYINHLANSPHVEKRRQAIMVLAKAPQMSGKDPRVKILYKAFVNALSDRDHVVRCIALEQVNQRWGNERIMNATKLFGNIEHEKDPRVRGMANYLLQDYPARMVVPALILAMKTETDLYAFRRAHESLNATTLAWVERVLPNDLEVEDMVRIRRKWMKWYEKNRDLYRRYEPKGFSLR